MKPLGASLIAMLAASSIATRAEAQTVSQSTTLVPHTLPDGSDFTRASNFNPTGINFEDCEKDAQLTFSLTTGGPVSGYQLQAWAGQGCTNDDARTLGRGTATATCWPLFADDGAIGVQQSFSVTIPVRTILAGLAAVNGGDISLRGVYQPGDEATSCHVQSGSGPIPIDVWFIWEQESVAVTGSGGTLDVNINADLLAASPPNITSVGSGDGLLKVTWGGETDPDILGFNVYYAPSDTTPSDATVTVADATGPNYVTTCEDAGFTLEGDDSGDATLVANDASCTTTQVSTPTSPNPSADSGNGVCTDPFPVGYNQNTSTDDAGDVTSDDAASGTVTGSDTADGGSASYGAGSISPEILQLRGGGSYASVQIQSNISTSAQINHLVDGVQYSVGVATLDAYGNVGALSSTLCSTPAPILDFWDTYRADGGQAGGGFCSVEAIGARTRAASFGIAFLFVAVGIVRKKKRRS